MYAYNAMMAGWLSTMFWWMPEINYWEIAMSEAMRSDVLPNIPGF